MSTAFEQLAKLPFSDVRIAFVFHPEDPDTEEAVDLYFSNASSFTTGPTETPPNVIFRDSLFAGWTLSRSVGERGTLLSGTQISVAALKIHDPEGEWTDIVDLHWNDRPFEVYAGGLLKADGSRFAFEDWEQIASGYTLDAQIMDNNAIEVGMAARRSTIDDLVSEDVYRGFGGAVYIPSGDTLRGSDNAAFTSQTITLEYFGTVLSVFTLGSLIRRGADYALNVDSSRQVIVRYNSSSNWDTGYIVPAATAVHLAVSMTGSGAAKLYAGPIGTIEEVASTTLGGAIGSTGGNLRVGLSPTGNSELEAWEIRIWSVAKTEDEIKDLGRQPLSSPSTQVGLAEAWKFREGVDTVAGGEKGLLDLELDPNCLWISSLDGDDPDQFAGSAIGRRKPRIFGRCSNVEMINVDTQRRHGQFAGHALTDLLRVYAGGLPMFPDETIAATGIGQIVFYDEKYIQLTPPLTAHRFVAAQGDPAIAGMRFTVTGTATSDGDYEVGVDGISADGLTIRTNGAATFIDETGPSTTVLRTYVDDRQYTYDLATATVQFVDTPQAQITADVIGWTDSGSATASETAAELLGESIDSTELSWDPQLGIYCKGDETKKTILDQLAASVFAYWIETRSGGYAMGTYRLATESDEIRAWINEARMTKFAPMRVIQPYRSINVGYDRVWVRQENVQGAVKQDRRQRLLNEYRYTTPKLAAEAVRRKYPRGADRPAFLTFLLNREDADYYAILASPLYCEERRWTDLTIAGSELLAVDLMTAIYIQHDNPHYRLTDGVLAIVLSVKEDSGFGEVECEVLF
jgi:hypothetical protein